MLPRPTLAIGLLSSLGGLLFFLQYHTLKKFEALPKGLNFTAPTPFLQTVHETLHFDALDFFLSIAFIALIAILIALEIRRHTLSHFFSYTFASQRRTRYLLLVSCSASARYYFASGGLNWVGDAPGHILYAQAAAQTLAAAQFPFHTFLFGLGSPYMLNYGPLFYTIAGLIDLFIGDITTSLKVLMGLAHIGSGLTMYAWANRALRSRRAGFISGLAYVLCFWHMQQVLIMGRLSLALFYTLLPLPFYYIERLATPTPRPLLAIPGGIALGALSLTHPGYGFFAFTFVAFYAAARIDTAQWRDQAWPLCLVVLTGFALSAYINVGMLFEKAGTGLQTMNMGTQLSLTSNQLVPDPTWQHLFVWSNFQFRLFGSSAHWYGGYLGLSVSLLAAVALFFPLRSLSTTRREALRAGKTCLGLSLALIFLYRYPPLTFIHLVQAMNAARYLLFLACFLSFMAGVGTYLLTRYKKVDLPRSRWFSILLLALVIDLGPTTFQHPYQPTDNNHIAKADAPWAFYRQRALPFIKAHQLPPQRIAWLHGNVYPIFAMGFLPFATLMPTANSPLVGEWDTLHRFYGPLQHFGNQLMAHTKDPNSLQNSADFSLIADGLYLLNIDEMLVTWGDGHLVAYHLPTASPLVASAHLRGVDDGEMDLALIDDMLEQTRRWPWLAAETPALQHRILRALWIVQQTQPDPPSATSQQILVKGYPGTLDFDTEPVVELVGHTLTHQYARIDFDAQTPCFARLAYAYNPNLRVEVDGQPVKIWKTAGHLIALPLPAGQHSIELYLELSPLRRSLLAMGLLFITLMAAYYWSTERRTNPPHPIPT